MTRGLNMLGHRLANDCTFTWPSEYRYGEDGRSMLLQRDVNETKLTPSDVRTPSRFQVLKINEDVRARRTADEKSRNELLLASR